MNVNKDQTPVAGILVTKCTKCKIELNHVVLALNDKGIVERVKCNTCGSEHKYHPDKKKQPTKKIKARRKKEVNHLEIYERLSAQFKDKTILPYSMSGLFKKDDVIEHKTFGRGYVTESFRDKMEVTFSDGPRILVYNRQ
jgi:hypothetical protein